MGPLRRILTVAKNQVEWRGRKLDLTYITPRLIVAGCPESDTICFLLERHGMHWHMWNLQSEKSRYRKHQVFWKVSNFSIEDHFPPTIPVLIKITKQLDLYLAVKNRVAIIHCREGKGRSGTVCCWYLIHQYYGAYGIMSKPQLTHIIDRFTKIRFKWFVGNGVSIRSQRRYLLYYINHPKLITEYSEHNCRVVIREIVLFKCCPSMIQRVKILIQCPSSENETRSEAVYDEHTLRINYDNLEIGEADILIRVGEVYTCFNGLLENSPFQITWNEMDGFMGTSLKGLRLFSHLQVTWDVEDLKFV